MGLELANPEKFGLSWAIIEGHYLAYQFKSSLNYDDYYIKSELGGKQIFGREFGKGAIWKPLELPTE